MALAFLFLFFAALGIAIGAVIGPFWRWWRLRGATRLYFVNPKTRQIREVWRKIKGRRLVMKINREKAVIPLMERHRYGVGDSHSGYIIETTTARPWSIDMNDAADPIASWPNGYDLAHAYVDIREEKFTKAARGEWVDYPKLTFYSVLIIGVVAVIALIAGGGSLVT